MTKPAILASGIGFAGALLVALGAAQAGPGRWLTWWVALSCILASGAYVVNWPGVYSKRNGAIVWWRALPLLPYLCAYWIGALVRGARRDYPVCEEVVPGLYVGGRVPAHELPPGVELVVDLTAEMPMWRSLRRMPGYRGHPVLDGSYPPHEEAFLELAAEVARAEGAVYIHCVSGVGRAPTAAAVVLMARGIVDGADAAVELVCKGRPAAALTRSDLCFVERMAARLTAGACAVETAAERRPAQSPRSLSYQ